MCPMLCIVKCMFALWAEFPTLCVSVGIGEMNTEHCDSLLQVQLVKYPEVRELQTSRETVRNFSVNIYLFICGGWGTQGKALHNFGNLSAFQRKKKLSFLVVCVFCHHLSIYF